MTHTRASDVLLRQAHKRLARERSLAKGKAKAEAKAKTAGTVPMPASSGEGRRVVGGSLVSLTATPRLIWRGVHLCRMGEMVVLASLVPDADVVNLWRVRGPDGQVTEDGVTLARAREQARQIVTEWLVAKGQQ
jgi:hypothetical protein